MRMCVVVTGIADGFEFLHLILRVCNSNRMRNSQFWSFWKFPKWQTCIDIIMFEKCIKHVLWNISYEGEFWINMTGTPYSLLYIIVFFFFFNIIVNKFICPFCFTVHSTSSWKYGTCLCHILCLSQGKDNIQGLLFQYANSSSLFPSD
jgi:hypothetical protein